MEFNSSDRLNSAIGLDGSELGGEYLSVEEARPRGDSAGSGRGGGGTDSGGRFGGRRGGGRGGSGGGRGRGTSSFGPSGKKTKFNDDEYELMKPYFSGPQFLLKKVICLIVLVVGNFI